MPSEKLSTRQLDVLVEIFQAGDDGWEDVPSDLVGLPTRILRSLIDQGLIAESVPGKYVAIRPLVEWRLWEALRVPVNPAFLQEQLATVGESVAFSVVKSWTWQERRDVWAWASAEQFVAQDDDRRRLTRPAILLPRPVMQAGVAGRGATLKEADTMSHAEGLRSAYLQVVGLIDQLMALAEGEPEDGRQLLLAYIGDLEKIAQFLQFPIEPVGRAKRTAVATQKQLQEFGALLRDKRNSAGLSRIQLARKAKLSDATIKFIETARHPPSRATLIRLIEVEELKLAWSDTPGTLAPPAAERAPVPVVQRPQGISELNCLLTPSFDPVRMVIDLGRFLNGAGGHVEQTSAYLDHPSAAAYLAMCQQSAAAVGLRASIPLAEAARCIGSASGSAGLHVLALGSGDATLEVRLVQHLLEEGRAPSIDLCLLDISQPLLACGLKHAADILAGMPQVHVWGMQCDFHDLPLYSRWVYGTEPRRQRRVFCMLGGTFSNLGHEPRFLQHALSPCARGDLLLIDMQIARATVSAPPEEIKKRDRQWYAGVPPEVAAWLSGPIWRHVKDVAQVDFAWELDTFCPLPGSYALEAVATVLQRGRTDRQFSMFRFRRYEPDKVAVCFRGLGWDEIGGWPFGGAQQPSSLRLFIKNTEPARGFGP